MLWDGRAPALPLWCALHPPAHSFISFIQSPSEVRQMFYWARSLLCSMPKVTRCQSTSPAFGQGSSHPHCRSIPPLHSGVGQVCEANWTTVVGEGGPGNPRAGAAASDMLLVLGALGRVCFGSLLPQQLLRCAGDSAISSKLVNAFPAIRMHGVLRSTPHHGHASLLGPRGAGCSWG